jgi:putative transposase
VTRRLYRCYGCGYLHFITFSCYRRWALLDTAARRDLFLSILEQVRRSYRFVVVGFVVMPEHVHLLLSEPERGTPSTVMQVLKQRFARRVLRERRSQLHLAQGHLWAGDPVQEHVWQRRFYDFPVWTENKRVEKLRYMHRNPVKRRLVLEPEQWRWSSYRSYAYGERGAVLVNEALRAEMKVRTPPASHLTAAG